MLHVLIDGFLIGTLRPHHRLGENTAFLLLYVSMDATKVCYMILAILGRHIKSLSWMANTDHHMQLLYICTTIMPGSQIADHYMRLLYLF